MTRSPNTDSRYAIPFIDLKSQYNAYKEEIDEEELKVWKQEIK